MRQRLHSRPSHTRPPLRVAALLLPAVLVLLPLVARPALAQDRLPRQVRTFVPPDQLVSFLPNTTFDQFVGYLNPLFQRVTGKQIVDPEARQEPIGMVVTSMHFLDAFELVLELHGLTYRETDRFFIIEEAPEETDLMVEPSVTLTPQQAAAQAAEILATPDTREIRISAIIFEVNANRLRQLGIDWNTIFGQQEQGGGGAQPGQEDERPRFMVRTERYFNRIDDYIVAPDQIDLRVLTQLFRLLEETGAGETLANPSVTVQSGEEGRIQIGSDLPVTVRDFAGNTVTQFVSTGIIVDVVPTLIEYVPPDTLEGEALDFVHLTVHVERSSGRPFGAGIAIDRNTANSTVLLLDGEQTIIGGLYSTEESVTRRGIPLLKDLPPWFFGLRYLFGFDRTVVNQNEMLIVLQAHVLDPLPERADRPLPDEMLDEFRERVRRAIERFDSETLRD